MNKTKAIIAITTIFFSFAILTLLILYPVPKENKDVINIVIGMVIGTGFGGVITYFFGSSDDTSKARDIHNSIIKRSLDGTEENS